MKKKVPNDIDSVQQILNIEYDKAKCTFTPAKTLNCKKVFSLNKSFKDIYHNDFFSIIPQYKKFAWISIDSNQFEFDTSVEKHQSNNISKVQENQ